MSYDITKLPPTYWYRRDGVLLPDRYIPSNDIVHFMWAFRGITLRCYSIFMGWNRASADPIYGFSVNADTGEWIMQNRVAFTWDPTKYDLVWTPYNGDATLFNVTGPAQVTYIKWPNLADVTENATLMKRYQLYKGSLNKMRTAIPATGSAAAYWIRVFTVEKPYVLL